MNFLVNSRGSQKTAISVLELIENGTISGLSGFRGEFPSEFNQKAAISILELIENSFPGTPSVW